MRYIKNFGSLEDAVGQIVLSPATVLIGDKVASVNMGEDVELVVDENGDLVQSTHKTVKITFDIQGNLYVFDVPEGFTLGDFLKSDYYDRTVLYFQYDEQYQCLRGASDGMYGAPDSWYSLSAVLKDGDYFEFWND